MGMKRTKLGIGFIEVMVALAIMFLIIVVSLSIIRNNYRTQIYTKRQSEVLDLKKFIQSSINCSNTIQQANASGINCFDGQSHEIDIYNANNKLITVNNENGSKNIGPFQIKSYCVKNSANALFADINVEYLDTRESVLSQPNVGFKDLFNGLAVANCSNLSGGNASFGGTTSKCTLMIPEYQKIVTYKITVDKYENITYEPSTVDLTIQLKDIIAKTKEVIVKYDNLDETLAPQQGIKNVELKCNDVNTKSNGEEFNCNIDSSNIKCKRDGSNIICYLTPLISTEYKAEIITIDDTKINCSPILVMVNREWNKKAPNSGYAQWEIRRFLGAMVELPQIENKATFELTAPQWDSYTPASICSLVGYKYNAAFEVVDKTDCISVGNSTRTGYSSPDDNYFYYSLYPTFNINKKFNQIIGKNPDGKCNYAKCSCTSNPGNTWLTQLQCKAIGTVSITSTDSQFSSNGYITIRTQKDANGNYTWVEPSITLKISLLDHIVLNYNKLFIKYKTLPLDGLTNPSSDNFYDNLVEVIKEYNIDSTNKIISFTHTPFMTTVYALELVDTTNNNPKLRGYETVKVQREWINMPFNLASNSNFEYPSSSSNNFIKGLDDVVEAMVKLEGTNDQQTITRRAIRYEYDKVDTVNLNTVDLICKFITGGTTQSYDCKYQDGLYYFNSWDDKDDRVYYYGDDGDDDDDNDDRFKLKTYNDKGDKKSNASELNCEKKHWVSTLICNAP